MERKELAKLYKKYDLKSNDIFKHKHYLIVTRSGIEKIRAIEKIDVKYDVIACNSRYAAVKATGKKDNLIIETFGSAKYGGKVFEKEEGGKRGRWVSLGTTESWYILEIAEKRAESRVVLKLTDLYKQGFFGEDEKLINHNNEALDVDKIAKEKEYIRITEAIEEAETREELEEIKNLLKDDKQKKLYADRFIKVGV